MFTLTAFRRDSYHTPHTSPQHDYGAYRREREHRGWTRRERFVQSVIIIAQEIRAQEENA